MNSINRQPVGVEAAAAELQEESHELVKQAEDFPAIVTAEDVEAASFFLSDIKGRLKEIEAKRLSFTAPINESLRQINNTFKAIASPFMKARDIIDGRIKEWHRAEAKRVDEENRRRAAEEMRRRKIQEAHAALGHVTGSVPTVERIEPKANKIGATHVRRRWVFEEIDFSKVPDQYKALDVVKINAAIANGARDIPGLKIYEDITTVTR